MLAPLLNLKITAMINISNPSSKSEFVGLFGSCSFCVHVILSGIHMQKNVNAFIFSYLKIFVFWVLIFYRGTISYFFTAHDMVVSLLTRASGSENE